MSYTRTAAWVCGRKTDVTVKSLINICDMEFYHCFTEAYYYKYCYLVSKVMLDLWYHANELNRIFHKHHILCVWRDVKQCFTVNGCPSNCDAGWDTCLLYLMPGSVWILALLTHVLAGSCVGSSSWVPPTPVGDLGRVPSSLLLQAFGGMNQQMGDLSVCVSNNN